MKTCALEKAAGALARPRGAGLEQRKPKFRVPVAPGDADAVVAYDLDSPEGRAVLGLPPESRCCDGAFWFGEERVLVLVELKGGDHDHAASQLDVTLSAVRASCPKLEIRAAIATHNSVSMSPAVKGKLAVIERKHRVRIVRRYRPSSARDLL